MSARRCILTAVSAAIILAAVPVASRADDAPKAPIDWNAKVEVPPTHIVRDACESSNAADQAYCYGEIMGVYDANFYLADALQSEPLCIPKSATPQMLKQAFLDDTKQEPDQLLGPFAIFFYSLVANKFPCGKGVYSTPGPTHGLNPANNTK